MSSRAFTPKVQRFILANQESPVVYASVLGSGGRGGLFRLADDRTFKLSADECHIVRPRWAFRQELEAG